MTFERYQHVIKKIQATEFSTTKGQKKRKGAETSDLE